MTFRLSVFSLLLCVSAFAACGAPGPQISGPGETLFSGQRGAVPALQHLYVSDRGANAVLRYPMTNGIPAATPDAVITGFSAVGGLAVGPDGRLYVVDAGTKAVAVYSPAPGSTAKPLRTRGIFHPFGLGAIALDPQGHVYVGWSHECTMDGFSCGYADVYSSFDSGLRFLARLSFGGGNQYSHMRSMAFNAEGTMVIDFGAQNPVVYFDPLHDMNKMFPVFCGASNPSGLTWGAGREIFETDLGAVQPTSPPIVDVIPDFRKGRIRNCPHFYTISSTPQPLSTPRAIAASGKYIYVTSAYESSAHSGLVFVLDPTKQGQQTPVAVIDGPESKLLTPDGIAIGP